MASEVVIVGAVRGLASEGGRVCSVMEQSNPDMVGLCVSKETLEGMAAPGLVPEKARPCNIEEHIYIKGLSAYGEVLKPAPCFYMGWDRARKSGLPVKPLDMDDEHFTAAYCKYVGSLDMIRQGRSQKLFARHVFKSQSPEGFVLEWDRLVNRLKGYRRLEKARERWVAKGICKLSEGCSRPLVIIELERLKGVTAELDRAGAKYVVKR